MAADFLLLQRYPASNDARFRHYDWHRPAFTFGYSQKISYVRAQLPADEPVDLVRRATGGGIVDHRNDWTYCLVIPRGHPLEETRAAEAYRTVHAGIADTLAEQRQPASLKTACEAGGPGPGVCFARPELHDVVHPETGAKIAGAALKRNKRGLLFQGSIARGAVSPALDWDAFGSAFVERLAAALSLSPTEFPWPDFPEEELSALTDQYASTEWNEFR
jgi:lipoate-protein ligase A